MGTALASLVWVLGLLYLWHRAEPVIARILTHWEARGQALIARATPVALPTPDPMPVDLVLWIGQQSERFAREQAQQRAHELYAEYRDWDSVRTALAAEGAA